MWILAEDIVADVDLPERDSSHSDGFVVKAEDTHNASSDKPVQLKVKGEI